MTLLVTQAQHEVVVFVIEFTAANGYPPSTRDICAARECTTQAVMDLVDKLRTKGVLTSAAGKARTLKATGVAYTIGNASTGKPRAFVDLTGAPVSPAGLPLPRPR